MTTRRVLLRAGGLFIPPAGRDLWHAPVGEVPPDVLRLDFLCTQAGMDRFRGAVFHAEPQEQHDLNWLMDAVTEYFEPPDTLGQATVPKEEQPYGAQQQLAIHLENLLILLARRYQACPQARRAPAAGAPPDRPGGRCPHLLCQKPGAGAAVDEVCEAIGCTRPQLQAAFRTRLRHTAMEEFSAMRLDYAAQLLARGDTPGEVAERMGYRSGAYFSQKFKEATGNTPSAYRRLQQGLPARRLNRQQKDKDESKTSIAETPPKK